MRAPELVKALLAEQGGKVGFTSADLKRMGLGGRTYLWQQVRDGHLIATKRGRYTIFLRPHVEAWLAAMPTITPRRASIQQPTRKRRRRARHAGERCGASMKSEIGSGARQAPRLARRRQSGAYDRHNKNGAPAGAKTGSMAYPGEKEP